MCKHGCSRRSRLLCLAVVLLAASAGSGAERIVVLDDRGPWRLHHTLRPPVLEIDGGVKPIRFEQAWLNWQSPSPPAGWMKADFDDGAWQRGPAIVPCFTPFLSRVCLRRLFTVSDPAGVEGLAITLDYHGGAVV